MPLTPQDALEKVKEYFPAFLAERERLDKIDRWLRWEHDKPWLPRHATKEYKELAARAQTTWLGLVVTSAAQGLHISGYMPQGQQQNAEPWKWWQANRLDDRHHAVHYDALGYGLAYVTVMPGTGGFRDDEIPVIHGHSPRNMIAFYDEPAHDDWPHFALRAEKAKVDGENGWTIRLYDDEAVYFFDSIGDDGFRYIEIREHDLRVCPVIRFANKMDNEGRTPGEVEPFIPIAARIDQTTFDRLVVQRFASWKVRTVTGMAPPDGLTDDEAAAWKRKAQIVLKAEDLLVSSDKDTKFGTLDETPLDGFINAMKADIGVLAAVSQTPAHEMLGQLANLSAEALAAARASLTAKIEERKYPFGESWEQTLRLAAWVMRDEESAHDYSAQVMWRDTEPRSLAQAADALGKIATMLGVPAEVLLTKLPNFTQQDIDLALSLMSKQPRKAVSQQ